MKAASAAYGRSYVRHGERKRDRDRDRARLVGCCAVAVLVSTLIAASASAAGPPSRRYHQGRRWLGTTSATCVAPAGWSAEPLFPAPAPPGTAGLCVYSWLSSPAPPMEADLDDLFAASGAIQMVEDVPVVVPMQAAPPWSSAELGYFAGLRAAFLQHVGTAQLLRSFPQPPVARIVVIDSAPTAAHGMIQPGGGSRHGDTLAHLIEDIVCVPPVPGAERRCAAEVTSELALPWLAPGVRGASGGHSGSLVDLARAIHSATVRWEHDKATLPKAPSRLILNLSVGWEDTALIADCPSSAPAPVSLPAQGVQIALQYAAARDAIIVSAAGNDAGGPSPRTGLTCPGNYQALPKSSVPGAPVLTAVSGVDYSDRPLESARPYGHTGVVALAFAGVAWGTAEVAPPSLVGSSVATAVVSAISGLVLSQKPSWSPATVIQAIYAGGAPVSTPAESCPLGFSSCSTRRASACGALSYAGAVVSCTPAPALPWSSPSLPAELAALAASVHPTLRAASFTPLYKDPRFLLPSMQVEPWTFPMPISATCPTCYLADATSTLAQSSSSSRSRSLWSSPWSLLRPALNRARHPALIPALTPVPDQLTLPSLGRPLQIPMLLVHLDDGSWLGVQLEGPLAAGVPYRFNLPPLPPVRSVYLSGFDWQEQHSIMEQIFVHR